MKLLMIFFVATSLFASICTKDDRIPSYEKGIGRLSNGCTVTLIGRTTVLTAGHCVSRHNGELFVEFNVLRSKGSLYSSQVRRSHYTDQYEIDYKSLLYTFTGLGKDYAVMRLKRNKYTDRFAGDVYGYRQIDYHYFKKPGDTYQVTGYGTSKITTLNLVQKTHYGFAKAIDSKRGILTYRLDTTGGNSGSAIIDVGTGMIVGVHTNGGCTDRHLRDESANLGALIRSNKELIRFIKSSLSYERYSL